MNAEIIAIVIGLILLAAVIGFSIGRDCGESSEKARLKKSLKAELSRAGFAKWHCRAEEDGCKSTFTLEKKYIALDRVIERTFDPYWYY